MFKSVRYLLVLALLLTLLTGVTTASAAGGWTVTQLAESSFPGWLNPQVSGDRVVWEGDDGEIYTWVAGDAAPTNISKTEGIGGFAPQVSGDRVVWCGDDGEIYTWAVGDAAPVKISADIGGSQPQISGDRVVWESWDGNDYEIYTWVVGDAAPTNISNSDGIHDQDPQVSGDRVVWDGWEGGTGEIYTWAVGDAAPTNISNSEAMNDYRPQVSGDRVVWSKSDGVEEEFNDDDVYTWTIGDAAATNISNSGGIDEHEPQVSGDRVVWSGNDGNSWEIYSWTIGDAAPLNISNSAAAYNSFPRVFGDRIVWVGSDEIFTWAVGDDAPVNISNSDGIADEEPRVSGDRVVWHGLSSSGVYKDVVYTATPDAGVEPSTIPLEHDAAGVVFDRFVTGYSTAYSGGGYVYSRWAGTTLKASFTGSKVSWIGPKQPSYGMADVYIDGAKVASDVDCYQASPGSLSATIWESAALADGPHTIELRLVGHKNAASSNYIVVLDKFDVTGSSPSGGGTRYDDLTASPGYTGTWLHYVNPTYFNKTYAYSRWAGAAFTVAFTGTRVSWIGPKTPNYGIADVYIDSVKVATVDCYKPDLASQGWREVIWTSNVLAPGAHTLSIPPTGTKNPAATAANVVVDAIDVRE